MAYLAAALMMISWIAAGIYMVSYGYVKLAFMCLLIGACITVRSRKGEDID